MAQTAEIIQFSARRERVGEQADAIDLGYINLYRSLQECSFSRKPEYMSAWVHVLLNASHKPYKTMLGNTEVTLQPGQFIAGRKKLAQQVGVTEKQMRGILSFFTKEGMISAESNRMGSIFTVCKHGIYNEKQGQPRANVSGQLKGQAKASHGEAFEEYGANVKANSETPNRATIQEYNTNTNHCSNNNLVTTDVETTDKKSSSNSKFSYPEQFEWIWANRPRREGSDNKRKAFTGCNARIKSGATWRQLAEGMKRYRAFCVAKDQINTSYTMQMATFFGTGEHYENDWAVKADQPTSLNPTESTKSSSRKAVTAAVMDIRDTDW